MFTRLKRLTSSLFKARWAAPMGKNKKASLTHAEIWDDSALVQSWEAAVEEYELYHSLHVQGENVEDVLRQAEDGSAVGGAHTAVTQEPNTADDSAIQAKDEDASMKIDEQTSGSVPEPATTRVAESIPEPSQSVTDSGNGVSTHGMPMPHPLMANVQDESLKNLMMSWYYAGYYTGLHEGQQQANRK